MKKRGFTLSEILVSLSVIGVISALTVPNLVQKSNSTMNAQALAANMATIENAFTTMLVDEEVDSLFSTRAWENPDSAENGADPFVGQLGRYLKHNGWKTADEITALYAGNPVKTLTNVQLGATLPALLGSPNQHFIILKSGAIAFIHPNTFEAVSQATIDDIIESGGTLFDIAADVRIDTNGPKSPNKVGQDIFYFYLGPNGVLYPIGGRDVALLDGANVWSDANASNFYACTDAKVNNNESLGYGCTARVIDEGFKINY